MMLLSWWLAFWLIWFVPSVQATEQNSIPDGAFGVVSVPNPQTGSLPFLYGLTGKGRYLTRNEEGNLCEIKPLPIVAGSIGAHAIGIQTGAPILLAIYDAKLNQRLLLGKKSVSADYQVTLDQASVKGDIVIESGLSLKEGFVLFPRKLWSSWFGFHHPTYHCQPIVD